MKKYIFSIMMAAMAAFTFSSCEDVPEPYTQPSKPETGGTTEGTPSGTGTQADPFNCAAAIQYCQSLESGAESPNDVYVKGKVQSIEEQFSANYGNCSVTLVDEDGTTTFKVWRAYYFDNKKWTAGGKELQVGDELVFCGKVVNFQGNTPETVQSKAWLVSINGEGTGGSDTPAAGEAKGTGTQADPFNSVAAQKYTTALEAGKATEQEFYIKGKIQKFANNGEFNSQYGNASFYIADDETSEQFYIFRIYYFGGEKWKEGDGQLKVGDEVVVCAKLINYMGNTPETNQGGKLISVNGKTSIEGGGSTETPDTPSTGEAALGENGTFEAWTDGKPTNWVTASSAGNASLSQSTDAHSGKYSVKVGGATSANKRIGYKEMTLKAGTYKVKFYAKAATATGGTARPGVVPVTDGKVGNYVYGEYVNGLSNASWTLVEQTLEVAADGTYCFVIMNSKTPGGDILIDDFTVTLGSTVIIK